ncbi:unnamed protein product, partial [Aphanomyces euteiches]
CVQSGMAAVSWRLGGIPISANASLAINWGLSFVALICAFISVRTYLEDAPEGYKSVETPNAEKTDGLMMAH